MTFSYFYKIGARAEPSVALLLLTDGLADLFFFNFCQTILYVNDVFIIKIAYSNKR